jgi:hypothetical protein
MDLLGTIKLSVDYFGYNHKIMKNYGWIQSLKNYLIDDDNYIKLI